MFFIQSLPRDITSQNMAHLISQSDPNTGGPSEDSGEETVDDQEHNKFTRRYNIKKVSRNVKPLSIAYFILHRVQVLCKRDILIPICFRLA